jgi:hypothetical protein
MQLADCTTVCRKDAKRYKKMDQLGVLLSFSGSLKFDPIDNFIETPASGGWND